MDKHIKSISIQEALTLRPGMIIGGLGSNGIIKLFCDLIKEVKEKYSTSNLFFQITCLKKKKYNLFIKSDKEINLKLDKSKNRFKNLSFSRLDLLDEICDYFEIRENPTEINIQFQFNLEIIKDDFVIYEKLNDKLYQLAFLNRNIEILSTDKRKKYLIQNYHHYPQGIKHLYNYLKNEVLGTPIFEIYLDEKINSNSYQIILAYRTDWFPSTHFESFANDTHNPCGGSLVNGIKKGLLNACKKYVKKNKLTQYRIRKKKFDNGLIIVSAIRGNKFNFKGSFRESLDEPKIEKKVAKIMESKIYTYLIEEPVIAEKFLFRFDESQFSSFMY